MKVKLEILWEKIKNPDVNTAPLVNKCISTFFFAVFIFFVFAIVLIFQVHYYARVALFVLDGFFLFKWAVMLYYLYTGDYKVLECDVRGIERGNFLARQSKNIGIPFVDKSDKLIFDGVDIKTRERQRYGVDIEHTFFARNMKYNHFYLYYSNNAILTKQFGFILIGSYFCLAPV